jgi:stage V sporulation protein G
MEITGININKVERENSRLKGFASVEFDKVFVVKDIRIIEGENGLFIAMPSRKNKEEKFKDICHPITNDYRILLTDSVLEAYNTKGE